MSLSRESVHRAKASPSEQIWGEIPDTHFFRCSLRSEKLEAMTYRKKTNHCATSSPDTAGGSGADSS